MIGPLFSLAAFLPAAVITYRHGSHALVTAALACAFLHACVAAAEAPARVQLVALVLVHSASAFAYLSAWAPRWRWAAGVLLVAVAAPESIWTAAVMVPNFAALGVGLLAWALAAADEAPSITRLCCMIALCNDAVALLLSVPSVPGRAGALALCAVQIAYVARR
jgi:hypothetical protein